MEELTDTAAYKVGKDAAERVLERRLSAQYVSNPYVQGTREWRAFELGWKHVLSAEQP